MFALNFNIPRAGMQHLLNILVKHGIEVPKTVFLLKKLCVSVRGSFASDNSQFAYIGIRENISYALDQRFPKCGPWTP